MSRCTIVSPVDGVVIKRSVEVGQTVAASFQMPELFQIARDLALMQVGVNVSEADVGMICESQPVHFAVDAFAEREFEGKVRQVRLDGQPFTIVSVLATEGRGLNGSD